MRGAGPGAQAARGSLEPRGPTSAGSPEAAPASAGGLLTHGGLRVGCESGPSRGRTTPWTCLPLRPGSERASEPPGPAAVRAACRLPPGRRASGGRKGPGETRCGQAFPAVVISAARSGREPERSGSLRSRSFLPGDRELRLLPGPTADGSAGRGPVPELGSAEGAHPAGWPLAGGGGPRVPLPPVQGVKSAMMSGWDRRARGGDSSASSSPGEVGSEFGS